MRRKPAQRRWYDDACGTAHALDLVGERWALLVMRELMFGPKRFSDLRASLPGISANVLTQRLEGLEAAGVLVRRRLPPPAAAQVYELTAWGYESEPIFQALGRWAARSPVARPDAAVQRGLAAAVAPDHARPGAGRRDSRRGSASASAPRPSSRHLADGRIGIARRPARRRRPDLHRHRRRSSPRAIYGGQPLAALEAAGRAADRGRPRSRRLVRDAVPAAAQGRAAGLDVWCRANYSDQVTPPDRSLL